MSDQVTTGKILADTFATAWQLTRYYLSKLKESNPDTRHSFNGVEFNSIYWSVAQFDEENTLGIRFGNKTNKRFLAMHGIRYEASHTGHLGVIAKMERANTV